MRRPKSESPLRDGKPEQRYRICSDESGHDYFIKVEDFKAFEAWVEATEDGGADEAEYQGPTFDDNRIDGRFTFTDPRCE